MKRIVSIAVVLLVSAVFLAAQDTPKQINGGVLNGKAVSLPRPEYPEEARRAGFGAEVRVQVLIDENGDVISSSALRIKAEESGHAPEINDLHYLLSEAAEKAALEAKFSPTLLSGQPVKVSGIITYNFVSSIETSSGKGEGINGGVLNGKAIDLPAARYPSAAKAVKASGAVTVQVLIDENGNVISASAVSGHPLLRASAAQAARLAKFEPTFLEGKPVKVSGVLTYTFVLPDDGENK